MRKNLKLFLALTVFFSILTISTYVLAEDQVTIKLVGWEASPLETKSVQKGLKKFMELNPDIKVEYTPVPGEYHPKILTMMAGNSAPDVFFLGSRSYRDFQERGVLLDLTEYFEAEYDREDFIPSNRKKMDINGHIYGVSSCIVVPLLYYNKDLFDEAGLPYPPSDPSKAWTWDEFVEVAKKMTITKDGKVTQFGAHGYEYIFILSAMLFSNDAQLFTEDYTEAVINNPEVKEVLQSILDLREKHGAAPAATFLEKIGMSAAQMLQTGRVAMIVDGSWALQQLSQMDFPVGIGVLPRFKKPALTDIAHVHAAYKGTKHPEAAWKLISFLSSEWYQLDLVKSGLWLPNRMSLYSEEGKDKWVEPGVYPEGFEKMLPYFVESVEAYPFNYLPQKVEDVTTDTLDYFWYDNQPLDKVLPVLEKDLNEIIQNQK